jgi:hypothetical protein
MFEKIATLMEKIIETVCPVKETRFEINGEAFVTCKPIGKWYVEGGKIRRPGICWSKSGRVIKVRDIAHPSEIRRENGLPVNPVVKVERDYSRLKRGINIGISTLGIINPSLRDVLNSAKPLIEIL